MTLRTVKEGEPKSVTVIEWADNQSPKAVALMEHDVQSVLRWLNDQPLRTITSEGMRRWTEEQTPPWTAGYRKAVLARVGDVMREQTEEQAKTVRARLLTTIDRLLPECRSPVVNGGDLVVDRRSAEYRRWIELKSAYDAWLQYDRRMTEDLAKTGNAVPTKPAVERLTSREISQMHELGKSLPYLTEINHTAAQGYLKMVAQLTGAIEPDRTGSQHIHFHGALKAGDLSRVPLADLEAGEAYLEQSRAGRPQ